MGLLPQRFFNEYTTAKGVFYGSVFLFLVTATMVSLLEPWIPCSSVVEGMGAGADSGGVRRHLEGSRSYPNPSFVLYFRCSQPTTLRTAHLLFLTRAECDFARRLVSSVIFGGIIGWERRQADRPAGIRTMSLVSLSSCLFTICSAFAFLSGPMKWDASRISAAIPSGVGFLGAGLIFQEVQKQNAHTGEVNHVVHGLTTATSVWLSAAVGVGCGGALYFVSVFTIAMMLILLRFGPRQVDPTSGTGGGEDSGYPAGAAKAVNIRLSGEALRSLAAEAPAGTITTTKNQSHHHHGDDSGSEASEFKQFIAGGGRSDDSTTASVHRRGVATLSSFM